MTNITERQQAHGDPEVACCCYRREAAKQQQQKSIKKVRGWMATQSASGRSPNCGESSSATIASVNQFRKNNANLSREVQRHPLITTRSIIERTTTLQKRSSKPIIDRYGTQLHTEQQSANTGTAQTDPAVLDIAGKNQTAQHGLPLDRSVHTSSQRDIDCMAIDSRSHEEQSRRKKLREIIPAAHVARCGRLWDYVSLGLINL